MSKVILEISSKTEDLEVEFSVEGGQELLGNARNRPEEMEQKVLEALIKDHMFNGCKRETYTAKILPKL
ncbi:hypothetical protein [Weissella viridescens]|uniref:hypothetical protein n=1 Tax=Weissella viridescens TaxID=1629 RepID=UPI003AF20F1B